MSVHLNLLPLICLFFTSGLNWRRSYHFNGVALFLVLIRNLNRCIYILPYRDENSQNQYRIYENDCQSIRNSLGFIINLLISDYNMILIDIWNSNFKYDNFLKGYCIYRSDTVMGHWLQDFCLQFSTQTLMLSIYFNTLNNRLSKIKRCIKDFRV
jgi:hypothetical protein